MAVRQGRVSLEKDGIFQSLLDARRSKRVDGKGISPGVVTVSVER